MYIMYIVHISGKFATFWRGYGKTSFRGSVYKGQGVLWIFMIQEGGFKKGGEWKNPGGWDPYSYWSYENIYFEGKQQMM